MVGLRLNLCPRVGLELRRKPDGADDLFKRFETLSGSMWRRWRRLARMPPLAWIRGY